MIELLYVLVLFLIVGAVLYALPVRAGAALAWLEYWLTIASTGLILFVMGFICLEVVMRYVFNSPIPGHLEGSELLVPMIVFFAISHTQAQDAHVGMTMIVEAVPPRVRLILECSTLILSAGVCAVLAYFTAKHAFNSWEIDDVTMTPPYFKIWPSVAVISVGYVMIAMRMLLQALHLISPVRYPQADVKKEDHLVAAD